MKIVTKLLAGGAGLAALATAMPASARYYPSYPYYGGPNTAMATQQCTTAVQNRLYASRGIGGVVGSLFGVYGAQPRIVSITRVTTSGSRIHVRGLASSGSSYSPYGYGYYGALGYAYRPDLAFTCSVDYYGRVRDVNVYRR